MVGPQPQETVYEVPQRKPPVRWRERREIPPPPAIRTPVGPPPLLPAPPLLVSPVTPRIPIADSSGLAAQIRDQQDLGDIMAIMAALPDPEAAAAERWLADQRDLDDIMMILEAMPDPEAEDAAKFIEGGTDAGDSEPT